jgi:hypothetical protein
VAEVVNINDILDGHVVLDLECLDRVYLNGYVPKLQVGGQVVTFLTEHLGNPIPPPALFKQIGDRFREAVRTFAEINSIPILRLNTPDRSRWNDRKVDHVHDLIDNATQPGVVAIVVAQEVQRVFMGYRRPPKSGAPCRLTTARQAVARAGSRHASCTPLLLSGVHSRLTHGGHRSRP